MRIGIFGSAFDPVTLAHLWTAKVVARRRNLDKIILIPSSEARRDKGRKITSDTHRWEMLQLAIKEESLLDSSVIEMIMPQDMRYTFYTMEYLKEKYSEDELFFIIGADNLLDIPKWIRSQELVENNKFIVIPRSQYDMQKIVATTPLLNNAKTNFDLVDVKVSLNISSSNIRREFDLGRSPKCMLPPGVYNYILENNLYMKKREEKNMVTLQAEIIKRLQVSPRINAQVEIRKSIDFMKEYLKSNQNIESLVLGLSGGQDSTLTGKLAQMAVNELNEETGKKKYKFIAVRLPYGVQRDEKDCQDAISFINPDKVTTVNIKRAVDSSVESLMEVGEEISDFLKGNEKARERMKVQYTLAGMYNGIVIGTDHAAEAVMGFYTKYGDGAADITPISNYNKRQGKEMLKVLQCPEHLYLKTPSADLEDTRPQLPDEEAYGVEYNVIDDYLEGKDVDVKNREIIEKTYLKTKHKREFPVTKSDDWWR